MKGKPLTLIELKQALKGRGSAMLLVLLALPFAARCPDAAEACSALAPISPTGKQEFFF